MSTHTPTTAMVRDAYKGSLWMGDPAAAERAHDAFNRWLETTLATVAPNPADARQVEVVARALCAAEYDPDDVGPDDYLPDEVYDVASPAELEFYQNSARAVLTALAALAESPKAEQSGGDDRG